MEMRPQFVHLFTTPIYSARQAQLETFFKQQKEKRPFLAEAASKEPFSPLYALLDKKKAWESSNGRAPYNQAFISALRYAAEYRLAHSAEDPLDQEWHGFVDDLSVWLFTEVDVTKETKAFLNKSTGLNEEFFTTAFLANPKKFILDLSDFTCDLPQFKHYKHPPRENEDNFLRGDFPSKLYRVKNTQVVRMSNVARDTAWDEDFHTKEAELNPEFRNYIHALTLQKKHHLYINLMDNKGQEKIKTQPIKDLETDPLTSEGIFVVCLNKNKYSLFYDQIGRFYKRSGAHQFKLDFLSALQDPEGDYYWSNKLDKESWFGELKQLIDQVHQRFFAAKETLSRAERLDFIELAYASIIDALLDKLQPDFVNMTCKQGVDRGPSVYSLYYLYEKGKSGSVGDSERAEFLYLLLAPSIIYHNRTGQKYGMERIQPTANRLLQRQF